MSSLEKTSGRNFLKQFLEKDNNDIPCDAENYDCQIYKTEHSCPTYCIEGIKKAVKEWLTQKRQNIVKSDCQWCGGYYAALDELLEELNQ